jgi:hypothetical protein
MSDIEDEPPEVMMLRLRNAERCMDQLHAALMKKMGMMHGSRLQKTFTTAKLRDPEWAAWDWQTIPPCPLQNALAEFDGEGGVQAARRTLGLQALKFEAVTTKPAFATVEACRAEGLQAAHEQLRAENLPISEGENTEEQLEHAFDTAFMQGLGQGLSMNHGNWHDLSCAIAYRHSLLSIVELIDRGKFSSARRALKEARSCELCRNPKEAAWDFAALAAKMDQVAHDPPQGGAREATSSSLDGGPSASSRGAGSSSDAVSAASTHDAGSSSNADSAALVAAPVVIAPAPLHALLQVVCTVLECFACHFTTHSLIMLRRSCRDAEHWRAEVPLYVEEPGADSQRLGLAYRLAKAIEQQQGLGWPSERVFEFSTSFDYYYDAIDELQAKLVGRRRERLKQRFRDHPKRSDVLRTVVPMVLRGIGVPNLPISRPTLAAGANLAEPSPDPSRLTLLGRIVELRDLGSDLGSDGTCCGSELKAEDERRCLLLAIDAGMRTGDLVTRRVLRFLVYEVGMSPGVPNGFTGTTPLHEAARVGSVPMMKIICSDGTIGASVPMPPEGQALLDEQGMSALGVAIQHGHVSAVKWLVQECGWDLDDDVELRIVRRAFGRCPDFSSDAVRAVLEHYGVKLGGTAEMKQRNADARDMARLLREQGFV